MDKNYYQNKILKQEKNEDKLSYEELMALKEEFEYTGFICKYNQKKEKLREREFCIQDSFYFKKNQVVIDIKKREGNKANLEEYMVLSLDRRIPKEGMEHLYILSLNLDENKKEIDYFSQINSLISRTKDFDRIFGINTINDFQAVDPMSRLEYNSANEILDLKLHKIELHNTVDRKYYQIAENLSVGSLGSNFNILPLLNPFAIHYFMKASNSRKFNSTFYNIGTTQPVDCSFSVLEDNKTKDRKLIEKFKGNIVNFYNNNVNKNYYGVFSKCKKFINRKFWDRIQKAKEGRLRPYVSLKLWNYGINSGGFFTITERYNKSKLFGSFRKIDHTEDFSEPETPDPKKLLASVGSDFNKDESIYAFETTDKNFVSRLEVHCNPFYSENITPINEDSNYYCSRTSVGRFLKIKL